jgi:hypothetical protein
MQWRALVNSNKALYVTLPKRQKLLLSKSIVNAVRSQKPPGRFLQKHHDSGLYYDVGDQRAQEKTSQALREGAPDIKKKIGLAPTLENETHPAQSARPMVLAPPTVLVGALPVTPAVMSVPMPPPVEAQGPVPNRNKKKAQKAPQNFIVNNLQQSATSAPESSAEEHYPTQIIGTSHPWPPQAAFSVHSRQQHYYDHAASTAMPPPVDRGLEGAGLSLGTCMSIGTIDTEPNFGNASDHHDEDIFRDDSYHIPRHEEYVAPVDGGLESQNLSFGATVMSVDSLQLERAGLSIGSMMSTTTYPIPVDGGLETIGASFGSMSLSRDAPCAVDGGLRNIGTSFGSLSLSAEDKQMLIDSLKEDEVRIPEALESMPTFLSAPRSRANLLACSDTDSDGDESNRVSSGHPSADWEMLQATLAAQNINMSLLSPSSPPPPTFGGVRRDPRISLEVENSFMAPGDGVGVALGEFSIPTTGFDRDLSALSVGDFEPCYTLGPRAVLKDRQAMPPPANRGVDFVDNVSGQAAASVPPPQLSLRKEEIDRWEDAG